MSYFRGTFFQNQRGFSNWLRRLADYRQGTAFPDPRTQDQQDAGVVLKWRSRLARRALVAPQPTGETR